MLTSEGTADVIAELTALHIVMEEVVGVLSDQAAVRFREQIAARIAKIADEPNSVPPEMQQRFRDMLSLSLQGMVSASARKA